jgi:hypothetical protein
MNNNPVIIKRIKIPIGNKLYDEATEILVEGEEMFKDTDIDEDDIINFLRSIYQPFKAFDVDGKIIETYNCN